MSFKLKVWDRISLVKFFKILETILLQFFSDFCTKEKLCNALSTIYLSTLHLSSVAYIIEHNFNLTKHIGIAFNVTVVGDLSNLTLITSSDPQGYVLYFIYKISMRSLSKILNLVFSMIMTQLSSFH